MDLPSLARGERIALMGVVTGVIGAVLPWHGAADQVFLEPTGGALVVLVVATLCGIVVLLRPWSVADQLAVAVGGGVVLGVVGQRAVTLLGDPGPGLGVGLFVTVVAGLGFLLGGGIDYLDPPT